MKKCIGFALACLVSAVGWDGRAEDAFLPSGRMALGANYWASHAATEMWRKWDAKAVDEDLRVLAANGFRILRVFPNWADFQPIHACYLSSDNFDKVNETRMFARAWTSAWWSISRNSATSPRSTASASSCRSSPGR